MHPPARARSCMAMSGDGRTVAFCTRDQRVHVIDATMGQVRAEWAGEGACVAVSTDGSLVASSTVTYDLAVWDAETGTMLASVAHPESPEERMRVVAFSENNTLACGWADGTVTVVRVTAGKDGVLAKTELGGSGAEQGRSGTEQGRTSTEPSQLQTKRSHLTSACHLRGHTDVIRSLAFSKDGSRLLMASADATARVWAVPVDKSGFAGSTMGAGEVTEIATLGGHAREVRCAVMAADGAVVAADGEGTVRVWDHQSWAERVTITVPDDEGYSLAVSPICEVFAVGCRSGDVRVYSLATGAHLCTLTGHELLALHLAFSHSGESIASGSLDGTVRVWPLPDRRTEADKSLTSDPSPDEPMPGNPSVNNSAPSNPSASKDPSPAAFGVVKTAAVRGDGAVVAVASQDNLVRLWDPWTGELLTTLEGHWLPANALAFSPDGGTLASGSNDHTVRLWSVPDGAQKACLVGHSGPVLCVAFASDGAQVVTGEMRGVYD